LFLCRSQGQQAFEQSRKLESVPRGLFNKCLLEVIDKHLGALDLFKAIMDSKALNTVFYLCSLYRNWAFVI
jgi:hypothetical protein